MSQLNQGIKAFVAGAVLASYLRVKQSVADGSVNLSGANDEVVGITETPAFAIGDNVSVRLRNFPGTRKVVCLSTCSIGDRLYGTIGGQVDTLGAGTGIGTAGNAIGKAEFVALEANASAGGTLEALPLVVGGTAGSGTLFVATADSAPNTGTAETAFPTNQFSVPANFLKPGDVMKLKVRAVVTGQNGTDTTQLQLYFGSVKLLDCTGLDLDTNEEVLLEATVVCRDIGATGHIQAFGTQIAGDLITSVAGSYWKKALTALDTTAAQLIKLTSIFGSASAGNTAVLRDLVISIERQ